MNVVMLMGRLTRDPVVRYAGDNAVARASIAVDRRFSKDNAADFINLVAFNKTAEFFEKYLRKGTKILLRGHIQTGSYTNKDGQKVYTTDVIVDEVEFAESKGADKPAEKPAEKTGALGSVEGFMNIPDVIDEELPFV